MDNHLIYRIDRLENLMRRISSDLHALREGGDKSAYSVAEAAKRLCCSKGTVRNLFMAGKLEGKQEQKRGKIYICPKSLEAYLQEGGTHY